MVSLCCCRCCCCSRFVLAAVAALLLTSSAPRLISASPQRREAAGVFMFIENKRYTLNFTAAVTACQLLNVTIATRAQVERALQEGLETCKFGWIHEQIAVIPRITSDEKCGKGNTGLVTWATKLQTKFAVFCYNASGIQQSSTARPLASTSLTVPMTLTPAVLHTIPPTPRTTPPKDRSTQTHLTETFAGAVRTTLQSRTSQTSAPEPVSSLRPTPPPHLLTTTPAVVTAAVLSTSVRTTDVLVTSGQVTLASVSPPKKTPGAGRVVLAIVGVIALLSMAAVAVRYFKLDSLPWCTQGRHKDDIETEMWKHADSEADLHQRRGEEEDEEEERQRKYSSDITLCVSPGFKVEVSGE